MNEHELRLYLAAHCPDRYLKDNIPKNIGGYEHALSSRGIGFNEPAAKNALHVAVRFEYADAMLNARGDQS